MSRDNAINFWLRSRHAKKGRPLNPTEQTDLEAALEEALAGLATNMAAEEIARRLRSLEPDCDGKPAARARLLHARGLAVNRLGFPNEAMGDLLEAADLFSSLDDQPSLTQLWRSIALVHSWRGNGREASLALLRCVAEANRDWSNVALAMFEAGRIELEIGRPRDAHGFFIRGLAMSGEGAPPSEALRARIGDLQALVAAKNTGSAEAALASLDLTNASDRMRHLVALERARLATLRGDMAEARAVLEKARGLIPADPVDFGHIERAHVEAEILAASERFPEALSLIQKAIARYAADDLSGREAMGRLLESEILDALGRTEQAELTLCAALRRAASRDLAGHVDIIRSRLSERGVGEAAALANSGAFTRPSSDRFVRRRPLGAGGFGSVSRAYDLEFGCEVALKLVSLSEEYDPAIRDSLYDSARSEVAATSRIRHPGVGRVYGVLEEPNGDVLVVREFIEGPTLRDAINRHPAIEEIILLLANLAHSLSAIHAAGIVHRDLKPENIILRNGSSPVIIDFGISVSRGARQSVDGPRSANYASPEQIAGGRLSPQSDLYALGVIAFEFLTGSAPPQSQAGLGGVIGAPRRAERIQTELRAGPTPDALTETIGRLLSRSPRKRRSAQDAALAFQDALASIQEHGSRAAP